VRLVRDVREVKQTLRRRLVDLPSFGQPVVTVARHPLALPVADAPDGVVDRRR
jgi:hypothetical protein